ncbi:hypothetical protein BLNAU_21311 [Blattamonas nauphoetae]|uniref:Uncharacterized protein n=1 Tax=Blattamonas nauphoetae TaxID=2049346 RepID=A0ABQ9WWT0_9EUKA|nr:hypothetical protein BLNAU_21311 [Blattamonas nauphoetae]
MWVQACSFSDLASINSGAAIALINHRADVVVKDSPFKRCHTSVGMMGGAISASHSSQSSCANKFDFTIFNCQFSNDTSGYGGHLVVQKFKSLTVAQCTFADSRSTSTTPLKQDDSIHLDGNVDYRFDNCTLTRNEGVLCGGLYFDNAFPTNSIILTDVLFRDNVCTHKTRMSQVTDCVFVNTSDISAYQSFDCFSTSTQPHCGILRATQLFPEWIGPSITSVETTIGENGNGDGLEVVLLFEGVFTGTSRKYDVTLEDTDRSQFVARNASFSKTSGTVIFALNNPNIPSLSWSTKYSMINVQKSATQSTSNAFVVGEVEEPDWTWWHHTPESRAGFMIGLPFTTPAEPKLTDVRVDMNGSNLNEAIMDLTVDNIIPGSFTLVVLDPNIDDAQRGDLSLRKVVLWEDVQSEVIPIACSKLPPSPGRVEGTGEPVLNGEEMTVSVTVKGVSFPSTITTITVTHDSALITSTSVVLDSASELTVSFEVGQTQSTTTLAFGEQYEISSVSAESEVFVNPSIIISIPCLLRAALSSLNLENLDEVILNITAFGFPSSAPITLTMVEVDENDDPKGSSFELTGTTSTTPGDSTHILSTRIQTDKLQYSNRFEIRQCEVTNRKTVLDGRVFFQVPPRPTITNILFSFATKSNTTFNFILNRTNLPVGDTFLVSLGCFANQIEVTFTTSSGGSSAELALGWPDTLDFDTDYPLVSVINKLSPSISIPFTNLTLQTGPHPNPLVVHVADSGKSDPKFYGSVERPCSSVDVAGRIVDA